MGFFANPPGPRGDDFAALGGQGISLISYSQNQEEAMKFLEWLVKDETQKRWGELGGYTAAAAILEEVGLGARLTHTPAELSGGMIKRAALARALALDPDVLLLDEPTAGLDPISAAAFDQLILTLRDALGLTVFLVTHDLDTLHRIADRIAVLAQRRVLASGTLEQVAATDDAWIRDYFHGPRGRAALRSQYPHNR
jgi:ABC-type transporter Mla maintaining outer membrane lipid asymmetry ATPase subunit MlaF